MKTFAVLRKIGAFSASVVRDFNDEDDAIAFADLMLKSEDNKNVEYYIAKVSQVCRSTNAQAPDGALAPLA